MGKITLVRLDGDAIHEVEIPVGETVIGRGPMMQCTDKRVSRTHAQIKVAEDGKIELTATSLNPCYYNDGTVVTKSSSVELKVGDRFSFLPNCYCYCVKASSPNDSTSEEGASSSDIIENGGGAVEKPFTIEENGAQFVKPEAVCTVEVTPAADDPDGEIFAAVAGVGSTADLSGEMTDPDVQSDTAKDVPMDTSLSSGMKFIPKWLLAATERSKRRGEEPSGEESGTKKAKTEDGVPGAEEAEENCEARDVGAGAETDGGGADAEAPHTAAPASAVEAMETAAPASAVEAMETAAPTSSVHQMSDDSESEELAAVKSSEGEPERRPSPSEEPAAVKTSEGEPERRPSPSEEPAAVKSSEGEPERRPSPSEEPTAVKSSEGEPERRPSPSEEPAAVKSSEGEPERRPSPSRPAEDSNRASGGTEEKTQSGAGEDAPTAGAAAPTAGAVSPTAGAAAPTAGAANSTKDRTRDRSPLRPLRRQPCKYGAKCYRKNPQHLAEYSHPGDPDYKEDGRPECPYGTKCYRKNHLHRQHYKHTKKPETRTKNRVKKGAPKDADEYSEEDDYDYDDPFLNDASSDDYEPTDSGSDDTASEGEEEHDSKRTKKEAKRFTRGKRKY